MQFVWLSQLQQQADDLLAIPQWPYLVTIYEAMIYR
jgi:hypothetical protein